MLIKIVIKWFIFKFINFEGVIYVFFNLLLNLIYKIKFIFVYNGIWNFVK